MTAIGVSVSRGDSIGIIGGSAAGEAIDLIFRPRKKKGIAAASTYYMYMSV